LHTCLSHALLPLPLPTSFYYVPRRTLGRLLPHHPCRPTYHFGLYYHLVHTPRFCRRRPNCEGHTSSPLLPATLETPFYGGYTCHHTTTLLPLGYPHRLQSHLPPGLCLPTYMRTFYYIHHTWAPTGIPLRTCGRFTLPGRHCLRTHWTCSPGLPSLQGLETHHASLLPGGTYRDLHRTTRFLHCTWRTAWATHRDTHTLRTYLPHLLLYTPHHAPTYFHACYRAFTTHLVCWTIHRYTTCLATCFLLYTGCHCAFCWKTWAWLPLLFPVGTVAVKGCTVCPPAGWFLRSAALPLHLPAGSSYLLPTPAPTAGQCTHCTFAFFFTFFHTGQDGSRTYLYTLPTHTLYTFGPATMFSPLGRVLHLLPWKDYGSLHIAPAGRGSTSDTATLPHWATHTSTHFLPGDRLPLQCPYPTHRGTGSDGTAYGHCHLPSATACRWGLQLPASVLPLGHSTADLHCHLPHYTAPLFHRTRVTAYPPFTCLASPASPWTVPPKV